MPRKVSVGLDLDALPYINEAGKVLTTTKAMDAEMDALDRAVDKVDKDMAELAVTTEAAKRQVDDLGDKARGSAADLSLLDARIKATKASVRELGLEFARTGDKAAGTNVARERSLLGRLERLRAELGDLADVATPNVQSTSGFGVALPGGHGAMSIAVPAIGAALPALLPIGAMVSGLIVGTVGGGGIIGGLAAAAHDSRVQSEWKDFTSTLTKESFGSESFVEPTVKAIGTIKSGLADLHLDEVLGKGAPAVEKLAEGVVGFAKGVLPGLDAAMGQSDKAATIMAAGFTDVGSALGEMIRDLAEKEGTMDGLHQTFIAITDAVKVTHSVLGSLTDGFEAMLGPSEAAARIMEGISVIPGLRHFFGDQADQIHDMRTETEGLNRHLSQLSNVQQAVNQGLDPFVGYMRDAAKSTHDLAGALDQLFKSQLDMDHATQATRQDIFDLTEQVKEHGHSLKTNTEEGLRNRSMIQGLIEDAMGMREATLQQTGSLDQANAVYMRQIEILKALLIKLGFTKGAIDAIVGNYEINVVVRYTAVGSLAQINRNLRLEDRLQGRASGGPVLPGQTYQVGEHGPEWLTMGRQGGYVTPMAQTWQGGGGAAAVSGTLDLRIIHQTPNGRVLRQELISDALRRGQANSTVATAYP